MRFRLVEHELVDSTSERAFAALAEGNARHGDVHCARGQSAGRGRRGARWESEPGAGVYLSVVLLPAPPAPHPAALTMAGGLAALEALVALGARGARLKWPNDVLVGGAKIAGVLVETRGLDPRAPHYVLGIGLDVAQREFPAALRAERPVTSLALLGVEVAVERARAELLAALDARLDQALGAHPRLAADFLAAMGLAHGRVEVLQGERSWRGRIERLDLATGLTLRTEEGRLQQLALEHVRALDPLPGG